jgi:prolyl-tRNA editing enzyme YbaK/EbsC (Cys-tRNA(Pro) deacylase)
VSSWPDSVERVSAVLRAAAVEARIEEFTEGTPTARDAAKAVGCDLAQIVKSLVFVCDGAFVLALVPGDRRADEALVGAAVPARLVRVARPEEVVHATGFEPGAVAPFPRRAVTQSLMDRSFLGHDVLWIGAGSPAHMASIAPAELLRLSGARVVDLVGHG